MLTVLTYLLLLQLPGHGFKETCSRRTSSVNFPGFEVKLTVLLFPESSFWHVLKVSVIYLPFPSHQGPLLISGNSKMTVSVAVASARSLSPLGQSLSGLCYLMVTRARHTNDHCIPNQSFRGRGQQIRLCVTLDWPIHYLYQEVSPDTLQKSPGLLASHHVALPAGIREVKVPDGNNST